MNNVLTLTNGNSLMLNEPKYDMSSPASNNIGLHIDQSQILQITQLMNELSQQQNHHQQDSEPQPIEILLQDSHHPQHNPNTVILSPNALAKLDQQLSQQNSLQQLFMPQIDQQQVHTIMLNGQPALFIPASAALNSNLFSQVMQTNQLDPAQLDLASLLAQHEQIKVEQAQAQPVVLVQQDANSANCHSDSPKPKKTDKVRIKPSKPKKLANIQPATNNPSVEPMQFQIIQNADQQWIIINNEPASANHNHGHNQNMSDEASKKLKRKACDCPNCVEFKRNGGKEDPNKRRTHKCHKCAKEYNKTSHLRAHLRGHDNYRPYVCDFKNCTKSFTRSDELKRHKRIHNDDRNFMCHVCKKKFLRSDHLGKHLLVHSKSSTKAAPGTVGGHLAALLDPQTSHTLASLQQQILSEQAHELAD